MEPDEGQGLLVICCWLRRFLSTNDFTYRAGDGVVSGRYDAVPGNSDDRCIPYPIVFGTVLGFLYPQSLFAAELCAKWGAGFILRSKQD